MRKVPVFVLIFAALVFPASLLGSFPEFSGKEYIPSELLPRETYRLTSRGADKLDINKVSASVLSGVPYIGKYAFEICALREELGGFSSLEQLALIPGIGPETCEKVCEYVRISDSSLK